MEETIKADIRNDIRLIGLKMPYKDLVCSYFPELPSSFEMVTNFADLFRLKKGKRVAKKENLEPCYGTYLLIYSPYSNKYFFETVTERTKMKKLFQYFNDMNLYVLKDHNKQVQQEKEEEDNDILI